MSGLIFNGFKTKGHLRKVLVCKLTDKGLSFIEGDITPQHRSTTCWAITAYGRNSNIYRVNIKLQLFKVGWSSNENAFKWRCVLPNQPKPAIRGDADPGTIQVAMIKSSNHLNMQHAPPKGP